MMSGTGADGRIVRVKGVPPKATAEDVTAFFSGFSVDASCVHLQERRGAGEAFVVFGSAEEAARACERDKEFFAQRFGQRYVRVVPAGELTPEDARRASALMGASIRGAPRVTKATVPAPAPAADVVKLRGLPVRAAASDVAAFFAGYKIKAGGVHLQPFSENRHSKVAFVEFASPEEAERALEKDHQRFGEAFGDRYCLLQKVPRAEMEAGVARFCALTSSGPATHSTRSAGTSGGSSYDVGTSVRQLGGAFFAGHMGIPGFMPMGVPGLMAQPCALPPAPLTALGAPWALAGPPLGMPPFGPPPGMPMPPGAAWPGTFPGGGGPAARYMVQDLSTGQTVFLDPTFNVFPCASADHARPAPTRTTSGGGGTLATRSLSDAGAKDQTGGQPAAMVAAAAAAAAAVAADADAGAGEEKAAASKGSGGAERQGSGSGGEEGEGCGSDGKGGNGNNSGSGGGSNEEREDRDGTGSDGGSGSGGRRSAAPLGAGAEYGRQAAHAQGQGNGNGVTSELRDGLDHKRVSFTAGLPDAARPHKVLRPSPAAEAT